MRKFTPEEIERLRQLCVAAGWEGDRRWSIQVQDTRWKTLRMENGEQVAWCRTSAGYAELFAEAAPSLHDALGEIIHLQLMVDGTHEAAMDRLIGMLEASEARVKQLEADLQEARAPREQSTSVSELASLYGATIFGDRR